MLDRANKEAWKTSRDKATIKSITKAEQVTADAVADNAATAQRIRAKLLAVLEREIDALPSSIGSEMHQDVATMTYEGNKGGRITKRTDGGKRYKLTDLTKAYRDLTDDTSVDINAEPVKVIIDV